MSTAFNDIPSTFLMGLYLDSKSFMLLSMFGMDKQLWGDHELDRQNSLRKNKMSSKNMRAKKFKPTVVL
jgi:hypothetical protein